MGFAVFFLLPSLFLLLSLLSILCNFVDILVQFGLFMCFQSQVCRSVDVMDIEVYEELIAVGNWFFLHISASGTLPCAEIGFPNGNNFQPIYVALLG